MLEPDLGGQAPVFCVLKVALAWKDCRSPRLGLQFLLSLSLNCSLVPRSAASRKAVCSPRRIIGPRVWALGPPPAVSKPPHPILLEASLVASLGSGHCWVA